MNLDATHPVGRTVCSAKGCRADAAYGLLWNNPKLHTPDRLKTWLACEDHRESLSYFLAQPTAARVTHKRNRDRDTDDTVWMNKQPDAN